MSHAGLKQLIDPGMIGCVRRAQYKPGSDGITADKWAGECGTELQCQGAFAGTRGTGDDDKGGQVCHVGMIACAIIMRCVDSHKSFGYT